ncbi:MAG: hypothetical protein BWK76_23950 [Desulfobulbaceae bacterium A2]|nr:MAG: hypothetical protein BWK76_23950 [Desulfobulbaceae bacterium A2]
MEMYHRIQQELADLAGRFGLQSERMEISARTMTPAEAIGAPEKKDFPLLQGKEVMIEARFLGSRGEAYTCMPGNYSGTVADIVGLPLASDFERACLIASLNAVMNELGLVERTVHCRNQDLERCAARLVEYVRECFGSPRIAFVGFQPAMIAALAPLFAIKVLDLDPANVGTEKYGVKIHGPEETAAILEWASIILATGSTAVNGTMGRFLQKKPTVFYGVSGAGISHLYGYERFCPYAS